MLTEEERSEIEETFKQFPSKRNATIEALTIVQEKRGWVSDENLNDIAALLEVSAEELENVATFYNLIFRQPVGRHVILICDSISCYVLDYQKIVSYLTDKLGIKFGETTTDKRFTMLPIPCLGTCDRAPAMIIDKDLHRDLTIDKLDEILAKYE